MSLPTGHVDTFARERLPPAHEWPDLQFNLPELQYPARLNATVWLLDQAVEEGLGDRVALRAGAEAWTYRALRERVDAIAHVLVADLKLVTGNRVLLRGPNTPMLAAAWLAVLKAGGIAVTTMPMLRAGELCKIANKGQIDFAVCDHRSAADLELAASQCAWFDARAYFGNGELETRMRRFAGLAFTACDTRNEDVALLAFTSGTTGEPKATMHFHRDVLAMADIVGRHLLQTTRADVYAGSPPLGFTFGLGALLVFPLRFRASAVLVETPSPENLLAAVAQHRVTCLFTAPVAFRSMLALLPSVDISSLHTCVSAGEALPKATSDAWYAATGIRIIDGIGATEMIHIFISARGDQIRPGATGKALPGYEARIIDEHGNTLPRGSEGRLAVRGPTGCRYLADARQRDYVQAGWNITGDRYYLDDDGYFWFRARSDDMIVSAGYNIAGPEVEAALLQHPAVLECAVVAALDTERGQIVKAFVVLRPGSVADQAMAKSLQDFVKQTIAPYKYPRAIEFVNTLPKTPTGKIRRHELRQQNREMQSCR